MDATADPGERLNGNDAGNGSSGLPIPASFMDRAALLAVGAYEAFDELLDGARLG